MCTPPNIDLVISIAVGIGLISLGVVFAGDIKSWWKARRAAKKDDNPLL